MTRTNPYGQALTFDEWHAAQAARGRPLTDDPMKSRRALFDARLSRLVQPRPRDNTQRQTESRNRRRNAA